jgi:hypothetical protein
MTGFFFIMEDRLTIKNKPHLINTMLSNFFLNENRGATPPGNRRNILKRGNKVTRRRDLRPAQPVVRQRGGTSKERNNSRKDYRS